MGARLQVGRRRARAARDTCWRGGCPPARIGRRGGRHRGLAAEFPDGSVGLAQSRVTETTRGTCIYSFVLHAPPVALEQVEGALEAQRATLQTELATLKSLMER